ncbi:hypothetical protein ABIB81_009522 [Bradyrhizobium sp. I1.7.5]
MGSRRPRANAAPARAAEIARDVEILLPKAGESAPPGRRARGRPGLGNNWQPHAAAPIYAACPTPLSSAFRRPPRPCRPVPTGSTKSNMTVIARAWCATAGAVRLESKAGLDWTWRFPWIVETALKNRGQQFVIDGNCMLRRRPCGTQRAVSANRRGAVGRTPHLVYSEAATGAPPRSPSSAAPQPQHHLDRLAVAADQRPHDPEDRRRTCCGQRRSTRYLQVPQLMWIAGGKAPLETARRPPE